MKLVVGLAVLGLIVNGLALAAVVQAAVAKWELHEWTLWDNTLMALMVAEVAALVASAYLLIWCCWKARKW